MKLNKQIYFKPLIWIVALTIVVLLALVVSKNHRALYRGFVRIYQNVMPHKHTDPPTKLRPSLALGVSVPKDYHVFGIDISRHQGEINWEKLAAFRFEGYKFEFAYIKASEGESWQDIQFDYNWRKAKKYKILRGAYHFYRPKVKSVLQMNNFTSVVEMQAGDLPPMLDVEVESALPKSTYRKGVLNCLRIMKETYGVDPIIYTNQKLYSEYFDHDSFDGYRFWIARLLPTSPRIDNWIFWQFTYKGVVLGASNEYVDINVFNGDLEGLKKLTKK